MMKKLISDKMRRAMDDMGLFTKKGRMADMKGRLADRMGRPNVMGRPDSGPTGMKGMADKMFRGDVSSTTPFSIQKPNMPQSSQQPNTGQYSSKPFPMKKGGSVKESKAMMKKEVSFMKKKGAPKSMLKHEMAEMRGGMSGYKHGGGVYSSASKRADGVAHKGKTKGKMVKMAYGGKC
jgi:hypothetical protein